MTAPTWNRPADNVRSAAEQKYQRLREDADLKPEAVQRGLAKAYVAAKDQLDALGGNASGARAADLAAAKRALHGLDDVTKGMTPAEQAATSMSFRDAQQRVANVTNSSEAHALLDQANSTGDELLARAVGNHAISGYPMQSVADAYLADRPAKQAALQAVQKLSAPVSAAAGLFEFACPKPTELSHLSESSIRQIAAAS